MGARTTAAGVTHRGAHAAARAASATPTAAAAFACSRTICSPTPTATGGMTLATASTRTAHPRSLRRRGGCRDCSRRCSPSVPTCSACRRSTATGGRSSGGRSSRRRASACTSATSVTRTRRRASPWRRVARLRWEPARCHRALSAVVPVVAPLLAAAPRTAAGAAAYHGRSMVLLRAGIGGRAAGAQHLCAPPRYMCG